MYGMRSTGKTVILRQLAGREEFLAQSAYLTLNYGEHSITEIYKWIGNLIKTGIKYFYIDEITWADGFVDMAMELADVWASYEGVKIMLSGTDSLAFTFAKQESLHGRYEQFSTTQMSYPEYLRIIKGNTLDFVLLKGNILDYVHCGGVFWKKTRPGRDEYTEYLESGVVWNIYNSILNTRRKTMLGEEIRFVSLKELFSICNGICNCVAAQYLYTHAQDAGGEPLVNALDTVLQNCGIAIPPAEASGIFPPVFKSETSVYEKEKVDSVIEIMRKIEFLTDIEIHSESGTKIIPMFAQTSVAHEFAYSALRAVLKSQTPRNFELLNFIEEYIDGELLDSACILTFGKDYLSVSKYRSNAGDDEIDIVAFDNRTHILYLYEIKRGLKTKTEYAKHLKKNYLVEALLEKYGTTDVKKAVLYRGDYTIPPKNDIPYYKIEDYLATYL
ncbi:MAG: AAA family ATPase [Clostridiales bacterium]|nr:AAA family ATPase [Clostridiales bacterium]